MEYRSDSVLDQKPMTTSWAIKATTPLFSIGDSIYNANHWVNYANLYRYKQDGTGAKPWDQVQGRMGKVLPGILQNSPGKEFNITSVFKWRKFRDGNLFFEIMQQEVWNKAQTDSTGLKALYEKTRRAISGNKA